MMNHMVNLGHMIFIRTLARVRVDVQSTAILRNDSTEPLSSVSAPYAFEDCDIWISRCPLLHVCIEVTLSSELCHNELDIRCLQQVFQNSLEKAELWNQLGLEIRYLDKQASYKESRKFQLNIHIGDRSSTTAGMAKLSQLASSIQPPSPVSLYSLAAIKLSLDFSQDRVLSKPDTELQMRQNQGQAVVRKTQPIQQNLRAQNNEHDTCKVLTGMEILSEKQQAPVSHRVLLSLLDTALRSILCSRPRLTQGVQCIFDNSILRLPSIAPAIFVPGHTEQLQDRASLIPAIARFLGSFRSGRSCHTSQHMAITDESQSEPSVASATRQDQMRETASMIRHLWMTMTRSIAIKGPTQRLKPLRLTSVESTIEGELANPILDIADANCHANPNADHFLFESHGKKNPLLDDTHDYAFPISTLTADRSYQDSSSTHFRASIHLSSFQTYGSDIEFFDQQGDPYSITSLEPLMEVDDLVYPLPGQGTHSAPCLENIQSSMNSSPMLLCDDDYVTTRMSTSTEIISSTIQQSLNPLRLMTTVGKHHDLFQHDYKAFDLLDEKPLTLTGSERNSDQSIEDMIEQVELPATSRRCHNKRKMNFSTIQHEMWLNSPISSPSLYSPSASRHIGDELTACSNRDEEVLLCTDDSTPSSVLDWPIDID